MNKAELNILELKNGRVMEYNVDMGFVGGRLQGCERFNKMKVTILAEICLSKYIFHETRSVSQLQMQL